MHKKQPPVLQVVGYSNSGKTTLLERIIEYGVKKLSLRLATIKHDVHGFQLDQEGKDTWKHRQAGAELSFIQSPSGMGMTMNHTPEKSLDEILKLIHLVGNYDVILVEGFKKEQFPKLVLLRTEDDFNLINKLDHIKLLLFWYKSDLEKYQKGAEKGIWPQFTSSLVQEHQIILDYVYSFWMHQRGDEKQ